VDTILDQAAIFHDIFLWNVRGFLLVVPPGDCGRGRGLHSHDCEHHSDTHWIGLREHLNPKPWFLHVFTMNIHEYFPMKHNETVISNERRLHGV
jgi:hypothetical protein